MPGAHAASLREIKSAVRHASFGREREPSVRSAAVYRQPSAEPDGGRRFLRPVDARRYATTVSHLRNPKPYAEA